MEQALLWSVLYFICGGMQESTLYETIVAPYMNNEFLLSVNDF